MNPLPNYPGAKTAVAKRLISLMPPHKVYVEGFLGSGAVLRLKRPAVVSFGIERFRGMAAGERAVIAAALAKVDPATVEQAMRS